jgi:hypothetical protein
MVFLEPLFGIIKPPPGIEVTGGYGTSGTGMRNFLDNVVAAILSTAGLLMFFYLLFGGFKYITAGGDDKAVQEAKKIITNALVGLVIVATAWFMAKILGTVLGIDILNPTFG